jgi:hypothetical protein
MSQHKKRFNNLSRKAKLIIAGAGGVALVAGGTGIALASTGSNPPARIGCVTGSTRALTNVFENVPSTFSCPDNGFAVSLSGTGATGPQGPSGVVSNGTKDLGGVASVQTGGSFSSHKTLVGTDPLAAGTYQVVVNFEATPDAVTSGAVFPFIAVYNGPQANGSFANDLFNVGNGALEDPTSAELSTDSNDVINSFFSGVDDVTVPAGGETLNIYAFGGDADTGQGTYDLNDVSVTATQLQVASN